ncbi:unnamed protein product [Phytophthora fragariaefolia]|uniref:Unnamed protein product n=1 Tax=Phytophthora fragariaefolia TaxID=1490495 RepID=A0A9W6YB82_9STRA|nr:unnamed protein product [Phytophthora fragariaefolia]
MSHLIKAITSDHDLIELAKKIGVHLDDIYESSEITKPLPKKGTYLILLRPPGMDVGHWTCVHDGEFFDSMGEAAPTKYGIGRYNPKQYQAHMIRRSRLVKLDEALDSISPDMRLKKVINVEEVFLAKCGIQSKRVSNLRKTGVLSKLADAAVAPASAYTGNPGAVMAARQGLKSLTGIGVYDSDSDVEKEGGRLTMDDVKKGAKRALSYAKRKGILTDAVDAGEKFLLSKATKPEHEDLIRSVRKEVRRRYGVGVAKKRPAKGSPEMKERMAKLRAMRKKGKSGGSFTL